MSEVYYTSSLAILTNNCPSYRDDYFERLSCCMMEQVNVYSFGDRVPTLRGCKVTKLKCKSLLSGTLLIPIVPLKQLLRVNTLITTGNPRILSYLFVALLRRFLGRRVIIWGQYRTGQSGNIFRQIRLTIWRIFAEFLVYTRNEQTEMRSHPWFCRKKIVSINNGLKRIVKSTKNADHIEEFKSQWGLVGKRIILSCARLLPKNKFDLVPQVLQTVLSTCPECVWVVIGDGPQMAQLQKEVERHGVTDNVMFLGKIFDDEKLSYWFHVAELFLHPAGLGLSLMTALEYGLPIVTNDNRKYQMPEAELALTGQTAITFSLNSRVGMANAINAALNLGSTERQAITVEAHELCEAYNTASMATSTCRLIGR